MDTWEPALLSHEVVDTLGSGGPAERATDSAVERIASAHPSRAAYTPPVSDLTGAMARTPMHDDEIEVPPELVSALLTDQFPQWANRPLQRVESSGTVNAIYRLGDDLTVRLPVTPRFHTNLDLEFTWLPRMAPVLPLAIPEPVARGEPGHGYEWSWSVYGWLPGAIATPDRLDVHRAAPDLAEFFAALHRFDRSGGPRLEPNERGGVLATRDKDVRYSLERLDGVIDVDAAEAAWERAVAVPAFGGHPVWIHGDVWADNALVDDNGLLTAVLDFGGLRVGDPAADLISVWSLLTSETRAMFRDRLEVDDATWERGRGWAIHMAVMALWYYADTNPGIYRNAKRQMREILSAT